MRIFNTKAAPAEERQKMIQENIKAARKAAGVTQKDLAQAIGVYKKTSVDGSVARDCQVWNCLQSFVEY